MEIKPVKHTEKPKYPLKTELNEGALKKQIPGRWVQSAPAKAALAALAVVTLAGCTPTGLPIVPPQGIKGAANIPRVIEYMPEGTTEPAALRIAPLFIHGEGRGTYGCDMVTSPAFLSEYEAMTVINEVAKEYGLEFTDVNTPKFYNVIQPGTDPNPNPIENTQVTKRPEQRVDIKSDFTDKEHKIAIEFVSVDDVKEWQQWPVASSVEIYDTKDAAAQLSEALESTQPVYYDISAGVLYDPCETVSTEVPNESEAEARERSKEQLKAQAKDFFEWLKKRGVI